MEEINIWKNKLAVLDKRLQAFPQGYRQNIAILGDDNDEIGYLFDNYFSTSKINEIIYIRTSITHINRRSFFKGILFSILSEYLRKDDALDDLINNSYPLLPLTVEFAKGIMKRSSAPSFLDALELINKFINETSRKCVFVIENFLKLKSIFPNFHSDFSKFIILQNNCMVVLSDINVKESEKALYSELNFLFGNFEKIIINDNEFFDKFISIKKSLSGLSCSPFFVSFFANVLGSNAIYHNLMQHYIRKNYREDDETHSMISSLQEALYQSETYFFQRFIKKINALEENFRDSTTLIKLLIAISEGYIRERELISLRIFESKNMRIKLQRLCDLNYIDNLGGVYRVKDPLFSFWASHVFKMLFSMPVFDAQRRVALFRKKTEESVSLFKEDFYKDKIKKVLELFGAFKDDTLRLGHNKYRLPLIQKSRLISYPEKKTHLLIGEGKDIVFVAIKEEKAEDNDIFDFIEKGSSVKGKKVKKIFISLEDFSSSARLIAKNNKLIAWGINEVNDLCRAYSKPLISVLNKTAGVLDSANTSNF